MSKICFWIRNMSDMIVSNKIPNYCNFSWIETLATAVRLGVTWEILWLSCRLNCLLHHIYFSKNMEFCSFSIDDNYNNVETDANIPIYVVILSWTLYSIWQRSHEICRKRCIYRHNIKSIEVYRAAAVQTIATVTSHATKRHALNKTKQNEQHLSCDDSEKSHRFFFYLYSLRIKSSWLW